MSNNNQDKKEYNPTLARAYETKVGFWSPVLTAEEYDAFMNHVKMGGRIVLKKAKTKKNEKSPDAYFEFIPPEKVKEMQQARESRNNDDI